MKKPFISKVARTISRDEQDLKDARFKKFLIDFKEYERTSGYTNAVNTFIDLYRIARVSNKFEDQYRCLAMFFELNRLSNGKSCIKEFAF